MAFLVTLRSFCYASSNRHWVAAAVAGVLLLIEQQQRYYAAAGYWRNDESTCCQENVSFFCCPDEPYCFGLIRNVAAETTIQHFKKKVGYIR